MIERSITGEVSLALSHFALAGLAAIADEVSARPSRLWWTEDQSPRPIVATELDDHGLGEAVRAHAATAAAPRSWAICQESAGKRRGAGLFTARAKALPLDEWADYVLRRRSARTALDLTRLDYRMISGMGQPAWWRCDSKDSRPDEGASRWEMKTRNRGEEFVVHRLVPLGKAVAARTPEEILSGLLGVTIADETASNGAESRTSTGLSTPGPVDSAVAWCALWGLSVAPPVARLGAISRTPGMWPDRRLHPRWAALPVFTSPVGCRRYSQIVTSRRFDLFGSTLGAVDESANDGMVATDSAAAWLKEQGVRAVVRFPILKTGSAAAPERQILAGEIRVL